MPRLPPSGSPSDVGQRRLEELGQSPPAGRRVAVARRSRRSSSAGRPESEAEADVDLGLAGVGRRRLDRTVGVVVGGDLGPVADQQAPQRGRRWRRGRPPRRWPPAGRAGCAAPGASCSRSRTEVTSSVSSWRVPNRSSSPTVDGPGDAVDRQARRCAGTRPARPRSGRRRCRRPGRCRIRGRRAVAAARRRRRRGAWGCAGRGSGRRGAARPRPGPPRSGGRTRRRPAGPAGTGRPRPRPGSRRRSSPPGRRRSRSPGARAALEVGDRGPSVPDLEADLAVRAHRPTRCPAARRARARPGARLLTGAPTAPGGAGPCPWPRRSAPRAPRP